MRPFMELEGQELEQTQSDESQEVSSEPQESEEQQSLSEADSSEPVKEKKETPFHEHPRFRELVEQKNQALEQSRALERKYQELSEQMKQLSSPRQEDALLAQLREANPEFADRFAQFEASTKELEQLKQWKQQMEMDQLRSKAVSRINSLHDQNKVPKELRDFYNDQLEAAYLRDSNGFLGNVEGMYKAIHERFSKTLENIKRAEREAYSSQKKEVAKVPTNVKGKPVSTGSKKKTMSQDELVQAILKRTRESDNL